MAASNLSRDVDGHRDNSGGASRPLPRPDEGDNVCAVPLWEREFCHNAYDIPWETFCRNKWFIGLYKKVMDWDDSEAFKNFLDAKETFRAKYHGEPYEDHVLDPDRYIDEVDHPYCIQNNSNSCLQGGGPSSNLHQHGVDPVHAASGPARMLPSGGGLWIGGTSGGGGGIWISGTSGGGTRNWNVGSGGRGSGGRNNWNGGSGGGGNNGSGRNRNGGGDGGRNRNGGGGSGISWNCFGRCNQRNQAKGQPLQSNSGGMQRNQNEVQQQQQRSGGRQQQSQRGTKWRLVPPPQDYPAA